jgi:hypothetical protein
LRQYTERVEERHKQGLNTYPDPRTLKDMREEAASLLGVDEPTTDGDKSQGAGTESK